MRVSPDRRYHNTDASAAVACKMRPLPQSARLTGLMRRRILFVGRPDAPALVENIDDLMAGANFRLVKATARTTAGFLLHNGTELFLKRTTASSWLTSVADLVRGSRAARALRGAAILDHCGFAHPRPVAAFELRSFGLVRASCVISEALHGARILSRFALADGRNFRRRKWISERLAREIRRLHEAGVYTRDLQETNLMLAATGSDITVYFIDLEDFRRARRVPARRRMLNLVHLDRSVGRFISRSQRLRFFYNYLGEKPEAARARRLLALFFHTRARVERARRCSNHATATGSSPMCPAQSGFSNPPRN